MITHKVELVELRNALGGRAARLSSWRPAGLGGAGGCHGQNEAHHSNARVGAAGEAMRIGTTSLLR